MKRKTYLWGIGILVVAATFLLLNLEESLEEEFTYIAKQTESSSPAKEVSYLDLPLSDVDKKNIYELLEPLANWSLISLGFNRGKIEERGAATKDIPILRYLAFVRMTPELQVFAQKIRRRSKIWKPFQQGFTKGLAHADSAGEVRPYLTSLSNDIGADDHTLLELAQAGDWSAFLNTVLFSK